MTVAVKKLAKQVLALPEKERAKLAGILFQSLHEEDETLSQKEWDKAWEKELKKRVEEIESGAVKPIPYKKVRKELDAILAKP